jgi:mannose/cellobiose epimerase-like protein (N-acyl-D-glucosamine 2-epimerase family)
MTVTVNAAEADIVATLKAMMIDHALPLWATTGWDSQRGGFVERLDEQGSPDTEAPRRVLVQARQIYCYAKAAQFGWYPGAKELALKGLSYLLEKGRSADGGFVHMLRSDGTVADPARDTYDHAFVLLALANVYQLGQDAQVRAEIDAVLRFIDQRLRSPHGGFIEGLPPAMPRRQNPQMHLFEAMIALFDATGDPVFQNRAGDFFGLFVGNLFDPRTQTLGEYFEEDWSRINPVVVEPGHLAEWTWLLKGFERITGCPTARHRAALVPSLLRYRDASGCLVDEGNTEGQITKSSRRCWPQTELAKAWIAQAESGEAGASEQARAALGVLKKHYLDHPVKGGWYDKFDGDGRSMIDVIPASTFYHVLCAVSEAEQVLQAQ